MLGTIQKTIANMLMTDVLSVIKLFTSTNKNRPGRPIVSANRCPTEKLSAYVDHFLNPLVKKRKSYAEDNRLRDLTLSDYNIIWEHIWEKGAIGNFSCHEI